MNREYAQLLPIKEQTFSSDGFVWRGDVIDCTGPVGNSGIQFAILFLADPPITGTNERWLTVITFREILTVQKRQKEIYEGIRQWLLTDQEQGQIALLS
jgi:hypothetical protein